MCLINFGKRVCGPVEGRAIGGHCTGLVQTYANRSADVNHRLSNPHLTLY